MDILTKKNLNNLYADDPEHRMVKDIGKLMEVTKDERFVTARHVLQSMWKVGIAGKNLQNLVISRLANRFKTCMAEKNCTLIRYDIIVVFRKIYDEVQDENVKEKALQLIETEDDLKYTKKYRSVWKDVRR